MSRPSWWQWAASYFMEVPVEELSSPTNPVLQVSLSRGRYQLTTEKSIYSFEDLYFNYRQAFQRIELPRDGSNVLILGLGLASVPFMLEKIFAKNYNYIAVEIDESVIYLASKYMLGRLRSPVETICTDAVHFVQQNNRVFDLIIVDLFLDDVIPEEFEQPPLNEMLRDSLKKDGLVLYNRLYRTSKDKQRTEQFYEEVFKPVFRESSFLNVTGNWILVGNR